MVVQAVRLEQVDDVEAIGSVRTRVLHPKVIPLSVPASAIVRLQDQVIFELVDLDGATEVSALKP